jgi:hypothetical protein
VIPILGGSLLRVGEGPTSPDPQTAVLIPFLRGSNLRVVAGLKEETE